MDWRMIELATNAQNAEYNLYLERRKMALFMAPNGQNDILPKKKSQNAEGKEPEKCQDKRPSKEVECHQTTSITPIFEVIFAFLLI